MGNRGVEQCGGGRSIEAWEDNQPWMDCLAGDEAAEVGGVGRHDHEVISNASLENGMIGLAQATMVTRMNRQMQAGEIQIPRDSG